MNNFLNYHIIDLTHTLNEHTPTWHGECGFNQAITLDYADCNTDMKFRVQKLNMHSGIGTHLDAPAHCFPNRQLYICITHQNPERYRSADSVNRFSP